MFGVGCVYVTSMLVYTYSLRFRDMGTSETKFKGSQGFLL